MTRWEFFAPRRLNSQSSFNQTSETLQISHLSRQFVIDSSCDAWQSLMRVRTDQRTQPRRNARSTSGEFFGNQRSIGLAQSLQRL